MNEARACHASVEVKKGVLYVFGGYSAPNLLNSIEQYTCNSWKTVLTEQKFSPRMGLGVVAVKGGVIILGGWGNDYQPLRDVYLLGTESNRIETLKEDVGIPIHPHYYPVIIEKEQIIVFGDCGTQKVCYMQLPNCEVLKKTSDLKDYIE